MKRIIYFTITVLSVILPNAVVGQRTTPVFGGQTVYLRYGVGAANRWNLPSTLGPSSFWGQTRNNNSTCDAVADDACCDAINAAYSYTSVPDLVIVDGPDVDEELFSDGTGDWSDAGEVNSWIFRQNGSGTYSLDDGWVRPEMKFRIPVEDRRTTITMTNNTLACNTTLSNFPSTTTVLGNWYIQVIEDSDFQTVNATDINVCYNSADVNLYDYLNLAPSQNIVFTGSGVVNGNFFRPTPALAGVNTITVTLTYYNTLTSISRTIDIEVINPVTPLAADVSRCGSGSVNLSVSNPQSNMEFEWYNALTGGSFIAAGNPISRTVTSTTPFYAQARSTIVSSCISASRDLATATVFTPPVVTAGTAQSFCDDSGDVSVTGGSPSGGSWSGSTYISSDGTFNTNTAPSGNYTVTYSYTDGNSCTVGASKTVTVVALPTVNAGTDSNICKDTGNLLLSGSPTGGTWSGSTNISGSNFNTTTALVGDYTLTYTYTNTTTGCTNSDTKVLTVNASPTVSAGSAQQVCIASGSISLTGGTPVGGSWSGVNVSGSTFNATDAGIGNHTVTYTYTDPTSGCSNAASKTVTVLSSPTVNAGDDFEACSNGSIVALGNGTPTGGSWSGIAVSQSNFDPSIGEGDYTLTYTYTNANGCVGTDTKIVTVNLPPSVEAGNNQSNICINQGEFDLTGFSPSSGGIWTGSGLVGPRRFSPVDAGVGTHVLTYTYTDGNGCTSSDTKTIIVNDVTIESIGLNQTFCSNSGTYNLNSDLSSTYLGGVWSGTGVSGNNFNPSSLPVGSYTISYRYTNTPGCQIIQTKEFTIISGPSVDAGASVTNTCSNVSSINLLGESPSGGTWSGIGVVAGTNRFEPSVSGIGVFVITYTYNSGSCIVTDTRQIVVNGATVVDAGTDLTTCVNNAAFLLTGASRNGGVWNGNGVSGGFFTPSAAGVGTHTISYDYTNPDGCTSSDTRSITVNAIPVVNAGLDLTVCSNQGNYSLSADASPVGGTFTGTGVNGLNFNPVVAGIGSHQVTYTYQNATTGCVNTDFRIINVIAPQTITVGGNQTACISATPFTLSGQSVAGGIWSGNGVSGSVFSPAVAGIGTSTVTYSVADGNGCNAQASKTITVIALPVVEAGQDIFVCTGAPIVSLDGTASPVGGTWSGTYISGSSFDVSASGSGTFTITYTYTNPNGCVSSDTKRVIVDSGALVNAGPDFSVCNGDASVDLASRVSPGGGSFVGPGVSGNNFNPNIGAGSYTITYSLTNSYGCAGTDQFVVTVNSKPTVNPGSDLNVCLNQPLVDLTTTAFPNGGVFQGPGVVANTQFDASIAGVGNHDVRYIYTDANGCRSDAIREITVTVLPTVNAGSNEFTCYDGGLINLETGVTPTNGTWSGTGTSFGIFNPITAGIGTHVLRYTIVQGNGCSNYDEKVITVLPVLTVDAGNDVSVCSNTGLIDLNNGASVTGGTWSGTAVTTNSFNPLTSGVGTYTVTYNYTNQYGCRATDTKSITVKLPQSVSVGSNISVCVTSSSFNVSSSVFPTGGSWSGSGLVGTTFTPSLAGIGLHELTYNVTDALGCTSSRVRTITVTTPPVVDAGANQVVCISQGLIDLDASASLNGGTWSGSGTSGSFFNPALAGIGSYIVTYTYDHGSGCIATDTKTITVRNDLAVDAGIDRTLCVNATAINLTNDPDKRGGQFSGSGVSSNIFNPATAGSGDHILTYTYTDVFGCTASDTKVIKVNDKPTVNAGADIELCSTADPLNISNSAFPTTGTWTGPGITGNFFSPQVVGTGTYTMSYSATNANGCTNSDTKQIIVKLPSNVDAGLNKIICLSSGLYDLELEASVQGGTWSGSGVSNNQFDPLFTGIGNHVMTYTYNNGQGCISTDTKVITVRNDAQVNAGIDLSLCLNSTVVDLVNEADKTGGVWSGRGVSGNNFNASSAGLGLHNIRYLYTDAYGCQVSDTKAITVNALPTVDAGPPANVCSTASPIDLSLSVFPSGGTWTGASISGNNFDPSGVGTGSYSLNYTYTNTSGCSATDARIITVTSPEVITVGNNEIVCQDSPRLDLDLSVSKIGGSWTGSGLEGSFFNPALAGIGTYTLTYTVTTTNGCISTASKTMQVRGSISVSAGADRQLCTNGSLYSLTTDASILGGTWSGNGVIGTNFSPSASGFGTHVLEYVFQDEFGCRARDQKIMVVNSPTTVDAGPPASICTTASPFDLTTAVSVSGGSWSGPGVSLGTFTPSVVGIGAYNLTYSYTNGSGCASTDTRQVTVSLPPTISIGANQILCANSDRVDLDLAVSRIGGSWTGSTGLEGSFFNPSLVAVGNESVTYTYNDGNGCISTASKTIQIRNALTVDAGVDKTFCVNESALSLTNDPDLRGGVWSGTGINGNNFSPVLSGSGIHLIDYRYTDQFGCIATDVRTFTVNDITEVDAGSPITVCTTAPSINLLTSVSATGGVFSGSGVTSNVFTPSAVGIGTYTLTYSYSNANSCVSSDTRQITVQLPPSVSIGNNEILCANSDRVDLDLNVSRVGGTWSGSVGLEGSFFNPTLVSVGNESVTYTYNDGNGCISSSTKTIQVRTALTVDSGLDKIFCTNGANYNLVNDPNLRGGLWSGIGVSGNNFSPSVAGVGNHLIDYRYTDQFGCVATDIRSFTVNDITTVDAGSPVTVCTTAPSINLLTSVSVTGGSFSGSGVTGNVFTPSVVGIGRYSLTYLYTNSNGCISSDIREVTVQLPPSLAIGANEILCKNSPRVDLDLNVSKVGGTWSGSSALEGSYFNAALVSVGNQVVTYTYTELDGCISSASKTIQVRASLAVNAGDDKSFCSNATNYNMVNDADITGGRWTGNGVSGTTFNPRTAGIGVHTITYTYEDDFNCTAADTRTFTVTDEISVNAGPDISLCTGSPDVNLSSAGFPSGGTWTGEGITNNTLSLTLLGIGSYTSTYTYTSSNGCQASNDRIVTVEALPVVDAGANFEICVNAAPITLTGGKPINGSWSGTGIIAGVFDPLSAGIGEHILTYSYSEENGCGNTDAIVVKVLDEPLLEAGDDIAICLNTTSFSLLTDTSIKGGTFTGEGVTGAIFNPQDAGIGSHVITYTVRFNGCELLAFRTITVYAPEDLDIGANLTVCVASEPFDLLKDVNVIGGTFTGEGIDETTFRPELSGVGSHVVIYTYENAFGCTSTDFRIINVQDELPINAGDDITLCSSVTTFDLSGRGSPSDGVYVGTGVLNNSFNPFTSGLGDFVLEYVVDNGNGCISRDEVTITVKQSTITGFGVDSIVCVTASPLPLNFSTELTGGRWSGNGVVNNVFYPSLADIGTHSLRYTNQSLDCDIAGNRNLTVVGLPRDASSELKNTTACEGDFISLTADINDEDRVRNVNVAWYLDGETEAFDLGEEIIYQVNGTNRLYYKAIDQYGCVSGQRDYINVQTNNPTAEINSNETRINFGKPVQFFAESVKNTESYEWDFGDGLISYDKNPWHYYYKSGLFDVTLRLTSSSGCETVIILDDYMEVLPEPGRDSQENPTGRQQENYIVLNSVHPNPFSDELIIQLTSMITIDYELISISTMGVGVSMGHLLIKEGENEFRLNTNQLASGLYYFRLIGPAGMITFNAIKK